MTGLAGLKAAADEQEAKKSQFKEGAGPRFAKFTPGEPTIVRFLEQGDDVQWCWVHDLPKDPIKGFSGVTPCLNQDGRGAQCPGCEMGIKRKIQGWINVIVRDAQVFERDADGKLVKNPVTGRANVLPGVTEDAVMVWNSGSRLFTVLANKDRSSKGLMSRDFEVTRTGEGLSTQYSIEAADIDAGPQDMSANDRKLEAEKFDVKSFTVPESYDIAKALLQGVPRQALAGLQAQAASGDTNIFKTAMDRLDGRT